MSDQKPDPRAFPAGFDENAYPGAAGPGQFEQGRSAADEAAGLNATRGMTLREWYAGLAMQGLVARGFDIPHSAARRAFVLADAMMEEIEKRARR